MNLIGLLFIALIFALIFWFLIQNYFSQSNCGNLCGAICQERIDIFFDIRHLCDHPTNTHCVNSVRIRGYSCSLFSCIRTEYGDLLHKSPYSVRISGRYGPEIAPYLDTFHAVTYQPNQVCLGVIHLVRTQNV